MRTKLLAALASLTLTALGVLSVDTAASASAGQCHHPKMASDPEFCPGCLRGQDEFNGQCVASCPTGEQRVGDGTCHPLNLGVTAPCFGHDLYVGEVCPVWDRPADSAFQRCPGFINNLETLKLACPLPWF